MLFSSSWQSFTGHDLGPAVVAYIVGVLTGCLVSLLMWRVSNYKLEQRMVELERDNRLKNDTIEDLRAEIDMARDKISELESHVKDQADLNYELRGIIAQLRHTT